MVTLASLVAVLGLIGPTAIFVAGRARSDSRPFEVALDVPTGLAVDVLSVLALALAMPLERAAIVSRLAWLAGSAVALPHLRRAGHARWPLSLGRRETVAATAAAVVGVATSLLLSVPYAIWDRRWHTPLVASLRGQRLPFVNVYQPSIGLSYHFAGDVVAAMLQAFSLDTLHASLALSLAHDAIFGLTGLFLGLWFVDLGARRAGVASLGAASVLLTGPLTLFRGGTVRPSAGYSWFAFQTLSFRPHVVLAGLLLCGFFGAVLARLRDERAPIASTAPALVLTTALLAITDEASIGLAGLSLGVVWLARPDAVHPSRARGIGILAALGLALGATNVIFHGALAPGAPRQHLAIVPWRLPGVDAPSVALPSPAGFELLVQDLWPLGCAVIGGLALARRAHLRGERAPVGWLVVLTIASSFALLRVEINRSAGESHRFVTAASLLAAFLAASWLVQLGARRATEPSVGFVAPALLAIGLALPAVSTLVWTIAVAPVQADKDRTFFTTEPLRTSSCRDAVGARFGAIPTTAYLSRPIAYLYAGCRPVFTPGTETNGWALGVGFIEGGLAALRELDRAMIWPAEALPVICPVGKDVVADPVCDDALAAGDCHPEGSRVLRCNLSATDREALLARGRARPRR